MTDVEILRNLNKMARYLKHRDGCSNAPDFASDSRRPDKCKCGLQQMRRRIRSDLKVATDAEIT